MSLTRTAIGNQLGELAQDRVAGVVPVGVIDRLEAIDVDEGDAEWLVVADRSLDLGAQDGEQGLAVRDAGQPVMSGARLDLEEGAAGGVEGLRQATLAGDAALAQVDRLVGLEGPLQRARDAGEAPADVAPRHEGHGRHARHDTRRDDERERPSVGLLGLRRDRHGDDGEAGDGEGGQEPKEPDEEEHRMQHGVMGPDQP